MENLELVNRFSKFRESKSMSGKRIREAREKAGLTPLALAELLGISLSSLNRIENDETEITKTRLMQIARALEISPIDLFEEEELQIKGIDFFEKYGKVESSYIRFILGQNEILKQQLNKCLLDQESLMEHLKRQDEFLRQFSDYLKTQKKRGGGGVKSNLPDILNLHFNSLCVLRIRLCV